MSDNFMQPETLLQLLIVSSNAKTDEEKTHIAWRAADFMWRNCDVFGLGLARAFNDLLQDKKWTWIEDLWTEEENAAAVAGLLATVGPSKRS